ncbi:hypothetical protein DD237_000004 [Peronospora effusa]|uniref:Uncharacterized protein n=1 Tax=Peronospora effusa TaxID=542832 RepID=A0A3R7W8D9_9STRA|nr:hypothetical protein DD237_000004 [Peronospora effusa]
MWMHKLTRNTSDIWVKSWLYPNVSSALLLRCLMRGWRKFGLAGGLELHEGEGRGYVGHVRGVILGVEEEILSVGLPIDDLVDSDGGRPSLAATQRDCSKIPSICYKIRKFGQFPLQKHFAFVQFVDVAASPESTPATLVIWSLKVQPSVIGYLFCCGGLIKFILRSTIQSLLKALAVNAAAKTNRHLD